MNKNIILQFLVFLAFVFFTNTNSITHALCPDTIRDVYKIENLTCTGECDNLYVKGSFGEEEYYLRNDSNCQHCNYINILLDDYGVFLVNAYIEGIAMNGDVYDENGQKSDFPPDGPALWGKNYTLDVTDDYIFSFQFEKSETGSPSIEKITCKENCSDIKITTQSINEDAPIKKTIYDQCLQKPICSSAIIDNYDACGGGYHVNTEFQKHDFEIPLKDEKFFITEEELQNSPKIIAEFGKTIISYHITKDTEATAELREAEKEFQNRTEEKKS